MGLRFALCPTFSDNELLSTRASARLRGLGKGRRGRGGLGFRV